MNSQFCRIREVNKSLSTVLYVNQLEKRYKLLIEQAYNLQESDTPLSDALYHEASKIKLRIDKIRATFAYNTIAA